MATQNPNPVPLGPAPVLQALPDGIEIFRPGTHTDDAGVKHVFSAADIDDMAASYNPALREAPLTVGHPAGNLPAYGWVAGATRSASGALAINTHQVEPQFAEMVKSGRFKKRSASFYPPTAPNNPTPGKWYLRHVAFLGAQAPAVAGLKDIAFAQGDDTGAVNFSEDDTSTSTPTPTQTQTPPKKDVTMTPEEIQALQAAKDKAEAEAAAATARANAADAAVASFAEARRTERHASYVSFAEGQVTAGRLLPKDKDMAVATLVALADAAPVEFAEGNTTRKVGPAQWLQDLIGGAKPAVSFGEFAPGTTAQMQPGAARGKSDAEIHLAATGYMGQHKVDYAEALSAVTTGFTA